MESDLAFIEELSNKTDVSKNIQNGKLTFYHANIGKTGRCVVQDSIRKNKVNKLIDLYWLFNR